MSVHVVRQQQWQSLPHHLWDLIVIGGGITGVGVAREATRRAARMLGASWWQRTWRVTLPMLVPGIAVAAALSFVAILLFGKRMPRHGSELGIVAVGTSFVLACATAYQWIRRVEDATGSTAFGALGKSIGFKNFFIRAERLD